MSTSAFSGPLVTWGQNPVLADYNPDMGSSMFFAGSGILDPRQAFTYLPGQSVSQPTVGWLGIDNINTITAVPYTSATAAAVVSANPTGATLLLTNVSSATTGIFVTQTFTRSDTGVLDTNGGLGLLALDAYTSVTASCAAGVLTVTANGGMPIGPGMVLISSSTAVSGGTLGANVVPSTNV